MDKVGVVILNYKVKPDLIECLKSVQKSSYKNISIYVVDNNSHDRLDEKIKKLDEVKFIQNGDNLGYAGGNNVGIKEALNDNCDYIFILNPDTTIEPNTISSLIEKSKKYDAQIVCPKIYFANSKTLWYAGKDFDTLNVLGKHRGVDQKDDGQFDEDKESAATGAAMLVKKEVFEKVGLLDEKYFLYLEDSDFSERAKKLGIKIMYIHNAIVYHKNAKSTGLGSPLQDYFITRNRLLFAFKYLPWRTRFALLREILRTFYYPTRRLALFDFLLGKFGKGSFIKN